MQLMTVALREEQETMDKPVFARGRNHRKLLTVGQAAEILSVHPNTIRRWTTRGLLQAYRVGPRGDRRFSRSDVIRLIDIDGQ